MLKRFIYYHPVTHVKLHTKKYVRKHEESSTHISHVHICNRVTTNENEIQTIYTT